MKTQIQITAYTFNLNRKVTWASRRITRSCVIYKLIPAVHGLLVTTSLRVWILKGPSKTPQPSEMQFAKIFNTDDLPEP